MLKFLKNKSAMFMCAGPSIIGFILGLIIGAVLMILMAKGILPGFKICPTLPK